MSDLLTHLAAAARALNQTQTRAELANWIDHLHAFRARVELDMPAAQSRVAREQQGGSLDGPTERERPPEPAS